MVNKVKQFESDLGDSNIPVFPPFVLNPELMERSRNKAMHLVRLTFIGVDVQEQYPEAYNEMLADLGVFVQDFDAYVVHAESVMSELRQLRKTSLKAYLDRQQFAPYYGRAKFKSALVIFAQDAEKLKKVKDLISDYRDAWGEKEKLEADQRWYENLEEEANED